jgi:anti-sigma B factor antagonist
MQSSQVKRRKVSDRTIILEPAGSLDAGGAQTLAVELAGVFADQFRHVILDMHRVETLSSAGIGVIYTNREKFRSDGGDVILCGLSENITYVLNELDVIHQMTVAPDVDKAISMTRT